MPQIEYGRSGTPAQAPKPIRPIEGIDELDPRKITETVALPQLTMIEFYTHGCGSCRTFTATLAVAAEKLKGKVKMYRVNDPDLDYSRARFGIPGHPTTVFFYAGRIIGSVSGAMPWDGGHSHDFQSCVLRVLHAHLNPNGTANTGATLDQLLSIIPSVE